MFRLAVSLVAVLVLLVAPEASAAELVVASAAAMQAALDAALSGYAAPVRVSYGTAGQIRARAAADDPLDVVILPPARLKELAAGDRVEAAVPLAAVEIGVALRDGAEPVRTETVAGLEAALLSAAAVGIADPAAGATTGVHLSRLLHDSGLDARLGSRLRTYPDGTKAMQALARGEVGIAMGQVSELRPVPGIFQTGLVPPSWQLRTIYAGAVATRSGDKAAARALLAWMASPAVTPYLEKAGLERP